MRRSINKNRRNSPSKKIPSRRRSLIGLLEGRVSSCLLFDFRVGSL
jgi:hypothetical protein